jgi:hypothetical protein
MAPELIPLFLFGELRRAAQVSILVEDGLDEQER